MNADNLQIIVDHLESGSNESIKMSLNNVHAPGLFSLVVSGTEPGRLTRIFIADKKLKPYDVQLHSHRYPIAITVLKGNVRQYTAKEVSRPDCNSVALAKYRYSSFLNGGKGLEYLFVDYFTISEFTMPIGSVLLMDTKELHTVSCSKGSMWLVEEQGFEVDSSIVLGVPFTPDGLYLKPEMFQINDKVQLVLKELKSLINAYNSVS